MFKQKYKLADMVIVKPYGFEATVLGSYFDIHGHGRKNSYRLSYNTLDDPCPHILEWYPEDMLDGLGIQHHQMFNDDDIVVE